MEKKIFAEDAVGKKMFAETYMLKKKNIGNNGPSLRTGQKHVDAQLIM